MSKKTVTKSRMKQSQKTASAKQSNKISPALAPIKNKASKKTTAKRVAVFFAYGFPALIVLAIALMILGGYVPGLSALAGATHPRDLGVQYTGTDRGNARMKSGVQYGSLPASTPVESSIRRTGSQSLDCGFTSGELTALLNERPYRNWPFEEMQIKISDSVPGEVELSGRLYLDKFVKYAKAEKIPTSLTDSLAALAPNDPVFYLKGKVGARDNKVVLLKLEKLEIGRIQIPAKLVKRVVRNGLQSAKLAEVSTASQFIEKWVSGNNLNIKEVTFSNGKMYLNGTIPSEELTVR